MAPSTGSNTISITYADAQDEIHAASHSYVNVAQSGQPDAAAARGGFRANSAGATLTTIADNAMIVAGCTQFSGVAVTASAPLVQEVQFTAGVYSTCTGDNTKASAGAQFSKFIVTDFTSWAIGAISLAPQVTPVVSSFIPRLTLLGCG